MKKEEFIFKLLVILIPVIKKNEYKIHIFLHFTFQQASDSDKWTYTSSEIDHGGMNHYSKLNIQF